MIRPSERHRRRGRPRYVRAVLLALGAVIVFAVGVAFGEALDDSPEPSTRTSVRTLRPATVTPPRRTVTVTVTND